jgi:hypothetical protein
MNNNEYSFTVAPIVIHTYTRLWHLKQTIDALSRNDWANLTDLFIASDAARNERDAQQVNLVRDYIQSITGFKSVTVIIREVNLGGHQNAVLAFDEIFKVSDRLIAIEDDTIVGRGFIKYVNQGLSLYSDEKNVFAVCAYLDKSIAINSSSDVVLLPGFSGWGYGIWRDRFYDVPDYAALAKEFLRSPALFIKLNLNRPDFLFGLKNVADGLLAADFAFSLYIIKFGKKCLFPAISLVRNIGNDGTGVHCIIDARYENQPFNESKLLEVGIDKSAHYFSENPFFFSLGGWSALAINLFKFFLLLAVGEGGHKKLKSLKNWIK